MDNVIGSLFSGFGAILGKLFGHPFDFLAGKSCSTVCGPTWDLWCYLENFCIPHLLKLATVSILFYFVVLFLYLQYKLGIFGCICHMLYKSLYLMLIIYILLLEPGIFELRVFQKQPLYLYEMYMGMFVYMLFSLRLLLHYFMLQTQKDKK